MAAIRNHKIKAIGVAANGIVDDDWVPVRPVTERQEQAALVEWLLYQHPRVVFLSIPNEGMRSDAQKFHMHATGMLSGAPDLVILPERGRPVFLEMKRANGGTLSKKQREVIGWLRAAGHTVIVAHGFEDARKQLEGFI